MDRSLLVPMDMPATYRIRVTGCLENDLAKRLWGMTAKPVNKRGKSEQTVLIGDVADQAALVDTLLDEYEVEREVLEQDISELLGRLSEAGLIKIA